LPVRAGIGGPDSHRLADRALRDQASFAGLGDGSAGTGRLRRQMADRARRLTHRCRHDRLRAPAAGAGHRLLPVHVLLLVEHGINIIELLDLEALAEAEEREFVLVVAPLKITGATGSPLRPLALVDESGKRGR
jgi:hypothetical protein